MKAFLALLLIFLQTLTFARVPVPHPDICQDSFQIARKSGDPFTPILNPDNPGKGAASGAVGALVAEVVSESMLGTPEEIWGKMEAEGGPVSKARFDAWIEKEAKHAQDIGQLSAATVALFARQDVHTAIQVSETAVQNNFWHFAIMAGLVTWSAYDVIQVARTQGKAAGLKAAGIEVGTFMVGGVVVKGAYKVGKVAYKSADAAWEALKASKPLLNWMSQRLMPAIERGRNWLGRSPQPFVEHLHPGPSPWPLGPVERGDIIEVIIGRNLHKNYPVIDNFEKGIATSIKSLNLHAKTYQDLKKLGYVLKQHVDKVAGFEGKKFAKRVIKPEEIQSRALDLVIPRGGTAAQHQLIRDLIQYGKTQGVNVKPIIMK